MCPVEIYLLEKKLKILGRSDYQFLHCASTCQVRFVLLETQTFSFLLQCFDQGSYVFEKMEITEKDAFEDGFCRGGYCACKTEFLFKYGTRMVKSVTNLHSAKHSVTFLSLLLKIIGRQSK